MNITRKKQTHRLTENKLLVTSRERKGGKGKQEQRIKRYKLLRTKEATRIYCTIQGIETIFYNNYKYCISFENCELLYCTAVTSTVHQLYYNQKDFKNNIGCEWQSIWYMVHTQENAISFSFLMKQCSTCDNQREQPLGLLRCHIHITVCH